MSETKLPFNLIEEYSEGFVDMYSKQPRWILRWGISLLFFAIGTLAFLAWYIKYPDVISSTAVITSNNPPLLINANRDGVITKLFSENGDTIKNGKVIGIMRNPTDYEDFKYLKKLLTENDIYSLKLERKLNLGSLQSYYNILTYELNRYNIQKQLLQYNSEYLNTEKIIKEEEKLLEIKRNKIKLFEEELALKKRELLRQQKLLGEGLIAEIDLEREKEELLIKQQSYEDLKIAISSSDSEIINLKNNLEILGIENNETLAFQLETVKNAYRILTEEMKQWEEDFLLIAPADGILNFHKELITDNFNILSGEDIFSMIPLQPGEIKGKLHAPISKSGKIKPGQRVNIYIDNFPYQEYGIIVGEVEKISFTTNSEGFYLVHVKLPNGLLTTYNKQLEYKPDFQGRGDIITEDLNLIQRIFQEFLKVFASSAS